MHDMTYNEQLLLAIRVATRAHAGQKRKDGTDYIAHPMRCMARASMRNEHLIVQIALVLHDVVEDTSVGFKELRDLGFSKEPLDAIDAVTKRPGEVYLKDFIPRCRNDEYGRIAKLYDIEDNLDDQSALDPDEVEFLKQRYEKARAILGQ